MAPTEGSKLAWRITLVFLVTIGLIGVVLYVNYQMTSGGSSSSKEPTAEMLEIEAMGACEGAVEQNLKAPATAKYDSSVRKAGASWIVTGSVDAENSFGALIRSTYECEVVKRGNVMNATLQTLQGP